MLNTSVCLCVCVCLCLSLCLSLSLSLSLYIALLVKPFHTKHVKSEISSLHDLHCDYFVRGSQEQFCLKENLVEQVSS